MLLRDKIGLVTGAGSGMGRGVAIAMAREGAKVVLVGRTVTRLESVQAEIQGAGGTAFVKVADVSRIEENQAVVAAAVGKFGRLDLAFNNAGGHDDFKPIQQTSVEESERVIDLNFKAVYYGVKFQVEQMLRNGGGSIVNNASIFGLKGMAGIAHYVSSKFAVVGLTRSVALEQARSNIRVNAVCPGATQTPNFMRVARDDVHALDGLIPMGRIGQPDEIAAAVLWLMSDRSGYATGSLISVDGGMSAG